MQPNQSQITAHMFSPPSTDEQINQIINSIFQPTRCLVKVVNHLREEAKSTRQSEDENNSPKLINKEEENNTNPKMINEHEKKTLKVNETPTKNTQSQTLTELIPSKELSGKRKRSITHFEGIPTSILSTPTPSSSSSATRKFITKRNIKQLDGCFSKLNFDNRDEDDHKSDSHSVHSDSDGESSVSNSTRSSGSFISTPAASEGGLGSIRFDFDKGYGDDKNQSSHSQKDFPSYTSEESDSDSDDEDDVVFILTA